MRIARCRVVRSNISTGVEVPQNQKVLVDPEGLPGVLMARVVATSDVGDPYPLVANLKSSLV